MTKAERQKKYKQIADLAKWVNEHREEVGGDRVSIIIGISEDEEKARMCMAGIPMPLYGMLETFRSKLGDALAAMFTSGDGKAN